MNHRPPRRERHTLGALVAIFLKRDEVNGLAKDVRGPYHSLVHPAGAEEIDIERAERARSVFPRPVAMAWPGARL